MLLLFILNDFKKKYPSKVIIIDESNDIQYGSKGNFAKLFESVREEGDYAFCDQDDIWDRTKLEKQVKKLREIEKGARDIVPAMICSDACIIDENDNIFHNSFVEQSGLYLPKEKMLERLLQYNFAQGTSMIWNYELHKIIGSIPKEAIMHDWWVALVAAGKGKICYIPEQLLLYRQHSGNVLGEFNRKQWHRSIISKLKFSNLKTLLNNNKDLRCERLLQAEVYTELYHDKIADRYIEIMEMNRFGRTIKAIQEGYIFLSRMYSVKYYLL